ncbi:GH25 family lysozyme, partial [Kocuria palustris]|uniref:GH25 family lysozyme n=1 Tax=Kocuria palustris TaxID=71999 RepID=UPI0021B25EF8
MLSIAALAVTSLLTAAPASADESPATGTTAAGAPAGKLPLVDGEVVSYDEDAVASYDDPELPDAAPSTGDDTPGATMGQHRKSLEEAKHLSEDSERTMERIESGEAPNPESADDTPAAASAAGAGPAGSMALTRLGSAWQPAGIQGMDVSGWQPSVNWSREYAMGARFAYVKATEGTTYRSPTFDSQYIGSYQSGMTRGAYHFAIPTRSSSGAAQADYFIDNGGGWSPDGRTLPGLLDIEYNPYPAYGNICFNLSQSEMVAWIESFSNRYEQRTGRLPAIYSTTDWWQTCTGNTSQFGDHPLMLARWTGSPGPMPAGWTTYDIWQYSESGPFSGDSNVFGGSAAKLRDLAVNPDYRPIGGRAPQSAVAGTGFRDVPADHQFATQIRWAGQQGYLTGWSDGTFRPNENIHRDAMAAV